MCAVFIKPIWKLFNKLILQQGQLTLSVLLIVRSRSIDEH